MRLSLEYIAGFLDCDGTIVVVRSRRQNRGLRDEFYGKAMFYSQNLAVLHDISETIGGKVTPPNTTMVHVLQLSTKVTVAALRLLAPFLRIKREQALLVIQLAEIKAERKKIGKQYGLGGSEPMAEEEYAKRIALHNQVCDLNHEDSRAFRTNRVNSGKLSGNETILSQAAEGKGSAEGATTRSVSPNNNPIHEPPARKGRDSLSSAEDPTIH